MEDAIRDALDSLVHRFSTGLDLAIPCGLAGRSADPASAEAEWRQGVEAERQRALDLLLRVRAADHGSAHTRAAALHYGVRACLDAAERWRSYARSDTRRFATLARAEVASRLACALREIEDRCVDLEVAA